VRKLNRTVKRAIDILQLIKDKGDALTLKEISEQMDMPISSTFDIVHTLYSERFLEYNTSDRKIFSIGVRAFEIGMTYRQKTNLIELVHPYAEKLMRLTNSTAFLAIVDDKEIVYLDKVEAETSVRTSAVLGSRKDMYSTGLGKAILMYYPEEKIREIFSRYDVTAYTEYTITNIDRLLDDLRQARHRGFATDDREGNINVLCIAHALFDPHGKPFASISIATMHSSLNKQLIEKYGEIITESALEISKKLGYLGQKPTV
jgi:DNA-binding IclR family transcriptional regulator